MADIGTPTGSSGSGETIHHKMYPGDERQIAGSESIAAGGTLTKVIRFTDCPPYMKYYFHGTNVAVEVFAVVHQDVSVCSAQAGAGSGTCTSPAKLYKFVFTNTDSLNATTVSATVSSRRN